MTGHALSVLEFSKALQRVAAGAVSPQGRASILALRPRHDRTALQTELARVASMHSFSEQAAPWGMPTIPEAEGGLGRLEIEGGVLDGIDVHRLGVVLTSSRAMMAMLEEHATNESLLTPLAECLVAEPNLEERIVRTVDEAGVVLDGASPALKSVRKKIKGGHAKIVRRLEAFVRELPERLVVADASVALRDGRYVVPIRREGRGGVGGIVHGESSTGATLFIEPPVAVSLMNELRELEGEEAREELRILREMSEALGAIREALSTSLEALIEFDTLHARARVMGEWGASPPELLEIGTPELVVEGGRHPLLEPTDGGEIIPFDLVIEPGERALVVSGPNTGGKSVFLKAVGLISALAQSGIVPPVRSRSRLPVFSAFFADIGDEQSIAESLSTFSAHVGNLREIVEHADSGSLVLIDEMGTGTDPTEGAALSRAVIEHLVECGAMTIATSHLGALKRLDEEGSGVVNASLQFDSERLEPTYHLVKGRPGRSFGLAIARRLGVSRTVLDRAESFISSGDASVDDLLERLERKDREAEELVASLASERAEVERLREELEQRESRLGEAERGAERRARDETRQLLLDGRRAVEEAIRTVKEARTSDEVEEAARTARRSVEEAAAKQKSLRPGRGDRGSGSSMIQEGQRVRIGDGSSRGVVVELRERKAVVDVSGVRLQVAVEELSVVEGGGEAGPKSRGSVRWSRSVGDARPEVDLRGLRIDEVDYALGPALDQAYLAELPELRVIHGKGTGAVRARVTEMLEADSRIRGFRLGGPGEGGTGVTVVSFQ